jgi:hypothetical protein
MYSAFILRAGSQALSAAMGGMAVFCLYYTGQVAEPDFAWDLFTNTLIMGGLATSIVFCQNKYLN